MAHARKPSNKLLEFTVPQDGIGLQLVTWVRGIVKSNSELVSALSRLRRSYEALLAGMPVTDAEELLWQVEGALREADRCKNAFAWHSAREPRGV
jgi:hypothetical protein